MGKHKYSQKSDFRLEGRLVGFVVEDGYKIKQMKLATAEGEVTVKLAKEARASLYRQVLMLGDWIEVAGEKKLDQEGVQWKLKVYQILPKTPAFTAPSACQSTVSPTKEKPANVQACILVCQKSDCCKLGAKQVSQALEEGLRDRGLQDQVKVKGTGCMKQCKAGPNIVMPDKTRYRRIDATDIPELLEKHFEQEETIPKEAVPELVNVG